MWSYIRLLFNTFSGECPEEGLNIENVRYTVPTKLDKIIDDEMTLRSKMITIKW